MDNEKPITPPATSTEAPRLAPRQYSDRAPRGGGRPSPMEGREGNAAGARRYGPPVRRVCIFCKDPSKQIDHKNGDMLRRYLTERGKIRPRRKIGTCAHHQRQVAVAIKRARHLALLPYAPVHIRGV